jgi:hypothetical protein
MTEIARLAAAIKTISEVYLGRVVKSDDKAGIAKWSTRLADYSTRLAVLAGPALEPIEKTMLAGYDHVLTHDEEYAVFLDAADAALVAAGKPAGRDGATRGSLTLGECIDICVEHDLPLHEDEFRALDAPGFSQ